MHGRVRLLRLLRKSFARGTKRKLRFNVPPDALRQTLLQGSRWLETALLFVHGT